MQEAVTKIPSQGNMTDWEKYEHVEQYLLLWIKQRSLDVYEYLKKDENREKLRNSNFNLQSMCQKLGMKKHELDMFFNEVCVISRSNKTREVCMIIEEIKSSYKAPIKPSFSKEAVELQLAVEKMILKPNEHTKKQLEPKANLAPKEATQVTHDDEPIEPDEFAFYDSEHDEENDEHEKHHSNVLYDDDDLVSDDFKEEEPYGEEEEEFTPVPVIAKEEESASSDEELEVAPIKPSQKKNTKKIEEDEVVVYDDEEPKEASNKSKILKKILLFSFVAFVIVAGIALLKHFGVISMILGTNKDTVPHIVKVEPSIPKENIPSFKKAPLPTPSDSYKTMQAQQDSSESNTTHTMPIITPIVPKTSEEPQTIAVPQRELLNEVNQSKESDERLDGIAQKMKAEGIEKEKQKEPTKPTQPFPTTMQEFNNLFERHAIKALVDEEVIIFDGNKFKEGDDFGKSLRLIKIVDKNTVKILDISKNEIKRVTR